MSTAVVAIVDIGKTNSKLGAVRKDDGKFVYETSQAFPALPGPPYQHLDTEGIWTWCCQSLAQLAQEFTVTAIVVTAHGATCALVDEHELVLPVLDYEDNGPDEIEADYAQLRPPFSQTYSPPLAGSLNFGRGVYWQAQKFPQEFARTRFILNYAQYWTWRFSGIAAGEVSSIGSHSDLWDMQRRDYSSLVRTLGWQKLFAPMRHASEILGPLTPAVAAATGLPPDCVVYCGIHDSNASLVPWLNRPLPFTVASTGTWVINFAVGAALEQLDPSRDTAANVTIDGEPIACSRWMGGREYANLVGTITQQPRPQDIDYCLEQEIMFYPPQGGQGGPFVPQKNQPAGHQLALLDEQPALRVAAASIYCALMLDVTLDLCASAGNIIVEGPFAHNEFIVALLAARRPQQTVETSTDPTGTSVGAARMAVAKLPALATQKITAYPHSELLKKYHHRWRARGS